MAESASTSLGRWQQELDLAAREQSSWETRADKVVKRYRDERTANYYNKRKFNLLWSNVQTLKPALYSRPPKVEINRRFNDADPIGRCASQILERATAFELECYDIGRAMSPAVEDRLLPGRGQAWVRYEVEFKPMVDPATGQPMLDAKGKPAEQIDDEYTPVEYLYWKDFLHSPARTWEEVRWAARALYLSREQGVKRWGKKFNAVPLDSMPAETDEQKLPGELKKAKVWEIWDKEGKQVLYVAKGMAEPLEVTKPPYDLENFFPCPKPLFATMTNGTLMPIPDFDQYRDQADLIDALTERIGKLTMSLKVVGLADASIPELQRLLNEGYENRMIPVENWAKFSEKGGMKGSVDWYPLDVIVQTLAQCVEIRQQLKQDAYEITGMADIIRGASVATETAAAQKIKAQYASLRLNQMREDVERFARDLIRIKCEIMCEKYQPQTLIQSSGIQYTNEGKDEQVVMQAMQLLRDEKMRDYRIDIETESMAQMDDQQTKQERLEFLQAVGGFIQQSAGMVEKAPEMAPLMGELLLFGVRAFRVGRDLEGTFEKALGAMQQKNAQGAQNMQQLQKQNEDLQKQLQDGGAELQKAQQAAQEATAQASEQQAQAAGKITEERISKLTAEMERKFDMQKTKEDNATKRYIADLNAIVELIKVNMGNEFQTAAGEAEREATQQNLFLERGLEPVVGADGKPDPKATVANKTAQEERMRAAVEMLSQRLGTNRKIKATLPSGKPFEAVIGPAEVEPTVQ